MHHMVDLETLDTSVSAIVVSVGIVAFDPSNWEMRGAWYGVLDMDEQLLRGRTRNKDTMDWWAQQTPEARAVFNEPRRPVLPALEGMSAMLLGTDGVWGNGADFDNIILGSLFTSFEVRKPWSYSKNRCHRTMKNLKKPKTYVAPERKGTHHNALDDAMYQFEELRAICTALNIHI